MKPVHPKSLAVLPFVNMSERENSEYFADGITEEIINALTRIPGLKVTSRTSSFFYKNKNIPIPEIGKNLRVKLVLEGSIRFAGDKVRITAQLIDAAQDFHFWSHTWDRLVHDIFAVQDEISLLIAEKAREVLGHFEVQDHLVTTQTQDLDAYQYYLQGRYHFRQWNPEDAQQAIHFYDKALELDSEHTQSLMAKADALGFLATTGFAPFQETWMTIKTLLDKVLAMDKRNADAYYQLANYHFFVSADFEAALEANLKGLSYQHNHPELNQFASFLFVLAGDKQRSRKYLDHILAVDPLSPETRFFDAYYKYMVEAYKEALLVLDALIQENNRNVPAHSIKAYCLLKLGRFKEALNYFEQVPQEVQVEEDKLGIEALAKVFLQTDDVTSCVKELEERAQKPTGFRADSFLPFIYASQKAYEKVYTWIEQAQERKSSLLLIQLNDPILGDLRHERKYKDYAKRIYVLPTIPEESKKSDPLNETEIEANCEALDAELGQNEAFLNPDLSLKSLAVSIDMHPNKLSWLINAKYQKNFNQLLNDYRIERFKTLALDPANQQFSLLGLAYQSGFNSKTVFNTYFKQATGLTPKAWLTQEKSSEL